MDARRLLIPAAFAPLLAACAALPAGPPAPFPPEIPVSAAVRLEPPDRVVPEPAPEPPASTPDPVSSPAPPPAPEDAGRPTVAGADRQVGAVRVFAWSPGRVYPVRTAPLRVTTLTLGPGETLAARAAGDTVRWQIGEAASGAGANRRTHVLLKPLERGLQTNLVLTTNRRVYLIDLESGPPGAFDPAIAWDDDAVSDASGPAEAVSPPPAPEPPAPERVVRPDGPLDDRYLIAPRGRRPRWTPTAVFDDGRRTFVAFGVDLQTSEAPVLFVLSPEGEPQMVNYRQSGGLFIVDRLFDRAELRLGDRRPQVVRIQRMEGSRP